VSDTGSSEPLVICCGGYVIACKVYGHIMRLDDMWLQTTLNTPNISGVRQIKKWSLVSLKAHQPRQGQRAIKFEFWYLLRSLRLIDILPVISQGVP
jgi:hypothetical protein